MDPLDGTKEFIKRNGEFTVNIALIEKGKPVLGVVYAPVLKVLYSAEGGKAWKDECGMRKQIQVRDARPPLVVISRSHGNDPELQEYLEHIGEHQTTSIGSVAEILPGSGRSGPALSALWANQYLGYRRWPCRGGGLPGRTFTTGRGALWTIPRVNPS
ncbi:3'(2'),5'-bisphosphate nucleotidase CysQ [Raoultella ornithinolytica]|nr:3'(2'),5'-bisphosphate nucleotidase CysQ [Raoultella ornithinolytica]